MLFGVVSPLVLSLLVAYLTVSTDGVSGVKEDPFKKVEGFLRKVPKGCDKIACKIEFYMSKIQGKLKAEDKSHMFRSKNKQLITVLKELLSLEDAVTSGKCRAEFWKQLKALETSVNQKQVFRVKQLVDHFGARYREQCIDTKITRHYDERSRLERRIHDTLEPFLNRIIYARVCYHFPQMGELDHCNTNEGRGVIRLLSRINSFAESDVPVFYDELMLMIEGLPQEYQLREAILERRISEPPIRGTIVHLLEVNLIRTCKQFVEQMEPIYSDAEVDPLAGKHDDGDKGSRFFLGLAHYRLCEEAAYHPDRMLRLVFGGTA